MIELWFKDTSSCVSVILFPFGSDQPYGQSNTAYIVKGLVGTRILFICSIYMAATLLFFTSVLVA